MGLIVFRCDSEAGATDLMEADPAVREGVMTARLYPYEIALHGS